MQAYRGEEGLRLFRSIAAEDLTDPDEVLASMHGLSVEFVPRKELKRQDRELLAALGHPQGRGQASPVFRVIRPGFHPWFVHAEEPLGRRDCPRGPAWTIAVRHVAGHSYQAHNCIAAPQCAGSIPD